MVDHSSPKRITEVRFLSGLQGAIRHLAPLGQGKNAPQPGTAWYLSKIMKFYYVYILHNCSINFIYIGYSENLRQRIQEHNEGKVKSTKFYKPLQLIFYEAYSVMSDAKRREKYLKTNKGKNTILLMIYFIGVGRMG